MNYQDKTKEELINELKRLQKEFDSLKTSFGIEITGLKRTEETPWESKNLYRTFFNAIDEGFCIVEMIFDKNGKPIDYRFLEVNPSFERQTDLINAQGRTMRELAPEHEEYWFEIYGKIAVTGQPVRFENRAEQLHRWYDVYAFRIGQPENHQVAILFNDITDRKRVEKDLILYGEIMKNISEGINLIRAKDEVIVFTNPKFDRMFGYKPGELIGKHVSILNAPSDKNPEETKKTIIDVIFTTGEWHGEILNIKKNGDQFWCYANVTVFDHPDYGKVFLAVHSNITEKKIAEEAIRDSEARFRSLFENSLMGISIATPDGHLVQANLAYAQMYGYKNQEEMLNEITNVGRLYANPVERKEVTRILRRKGFMEAREVEVVRRDGSRFLVLVSACEIRDSEGKLLYNQAVHIDVTDRRRNEGEIKKSKELLEKLNQHLNEIREEERANISREIHDQLGQSMTALKLDLNRMYKYLDYDKEAAAKLKSTIELVSDTIKNVQRISSDLHPGILDELGLASAVEWYCDEFEKRTDIKCNLKLDNSEYGDSKVNLVFFRVLQEALTNVIRHANATSVSIELHQIEKGITMNIKDNGIGITKEQIESYKSLGLISIRERVKQFNGTIKISSKKEKGTELVIFIPYK